MGVHDWTRVGDGVFHDFHNSWLIHLKDALNTGALPDDYFARTEQHYGKKIADVLTLHDGNASDGAIGGPPPAPAGSVAVADAPPAVRVHRLLRPGPVVRRKSLTVRRSGSDDLIAVIEIVSPGNKDGPTHLSDFLGKVTGTLAAGIHVVVMDLLPPNKHTPGGLHPMISDDLQIPRTGDDAEDGTQPPECPVALLSYESDMPNVGAYMDYLRVGDAIPDLPLFLAPGRYVNMPLGRAYEAAYRPLPRVTKAALEGPPVAGSGGSSYR